MDHPVAPESLERFVRGMSSREENRKVVAHLLKGCTLCARRVALAQALDAPFSGESDGYEAAFEHLAQRTSRARREGPAALGPGAPAHS